IGSCTVRVSAEPSAMDEAVVIAIEDDGGGIEAGKLQAIRQALEDGRELTTSGAGMGIANVNKRISLYYGGGNGRSDGSGGGGKVTIESEEGRGTRIACYIPIGGDGRARP